jgi:four helix bundle protein
MNNLEFAESFKKRTKEYVVRATKLYRSLPKTGDAKIFGNQFLRAASAVGSNYRASCRARSAEEFFSKMSIVIEEADESCFWMELIVETELLPLNRVAPLIKEGYEILSIAAAARKNTPSKTNKKHFPKNSATSPTPNSITQ